MILNKLIGYNELTNVWINPETEEVENLPSINFIVSSNVLNGYENFGTIPENWYKYGFSLIGSSVGYRDYSSWRAEIKLLIEAIAGVNYATWNNLNTQQKIIALNLLPTKIIDAKGFNFFAAEVTGLIGNGDTIVNIINQYLDNSALARSVRYDVMVKTAYQYLGKTQGLKAELFARESFTDVVYIERGVLYKAQDEIEGFGDWVLSTVNTSFQNTGLKAKIIAEEFTLPEGISVNDFCNLLIDIVDNGNY